MLIFAFILAALANPLLEEAVKPRGMGGVSRGTLLTLEEDTTVYRMWDGPGDSSTGTGTITNELGQWWTFSPPSGTVEQYRKKYAICTGWNDLRWISVCTLKAGATVVVGPTQSVSEEACGVKGEHYRRRWSQQVYIQRAWERDDLVCVLKYRANPEALESK
jgi:hypothetical protein